MMSGEEKGIEKTFEDEKVAFKEAVDATTNCLNRFSCIARKGGKFGAFWPTFAGQITKLPVVKTQSR